MNTETIEILRRLNTDFYRNQCDSFSATRKAPWSGWQKCLDFIRDDVVYLEGTFNHVPTQKKREEEKECGSQEKIYSFKEITIFDLACGNLRFEEFLAAALPEADLTFYAVDNCSGLVPERHPAKYQNLDVLDVLQKGLSLNEQITAPQCDLSVSFGFMHHVPSQKYREEILASLVKKTRSGGYVVVSLWQFLNSKSMAEKAQTTHEHALEELALPTLDENDFLLGWKNIPGAYRYCHSFSDAEIDHLVETVSDKAVLVARFQSDGRTDNLNTYVILKVC